MKLKAALIMASALVAGTAIADDNGFYAGAGVGWSQLSIPKSDATSAVDAFSIFVGSPLETWSAKTDESDIMWSAFVGYRFMKYVAVEVGYMDTGTASYAGSGTCCLTPNPDPPPDNLTSPASAKLSWSANGWPVSVLGIWPINGNWDVFGRVGEFFGNASVDLRFDDGTTSYKGHNSGSSNDFLYGVGFDGRFMENWAARFEWVAISNLGNNKDTGSADWNGLQFSLLYRF